MPNYRDELVEVDGEVCGETDKAWFFVPDSWAGEDAEENAVVPKSIGQWEPSSKDGVVGIMTVPTWFAEKESLT